MGVRKKEPGAKTEKRQHKCSLNAMKSASRTISTSMVWEQQRLAKQIKRVVVLRNHHIFAFCAIRKCTVSHSQTHSFNVMCTLCLPSHFSHFVAHRPSQKHVPRLLTTRVGSKEIHARHTLQIRTPSYCPNGHLKSPNCVLRVSQDYCPNGLMSVKTA